MIEFPELLLAKMSDVANSQAVENISETAPYTLIFFACLVLLLMFFLRFIRRVIDNHNQTLREVDAAHRGDMKKLLDRHREEMLTMKQEEQKMHHALIESLNSNTKLLGTVDSTLQTAIASRILRENQGDTD